MALLLLRQPSRNTVRGPKIGSSSMNHPPRKPPNHPPSRGKSLVPTNLRRNAEQGSSSSKTAPSSSSKRRRRCLPSRNVAADTTSDHPRDANTQGKRRKTLATKAAATTHPATPTVPKNFFPGKLYRLVEALLAPHQEDTTANSSSSNSGSSTVLSWHRRNETDEDDTAANAAAEWALVVRDKEEFLRNPRVRTAFPSQSTFRSFERQLNSWGFKRQNRLEDRLLLREEDSTRKRLAPETLRVFYHAGFQPGRPEGLSSVKRRPPGKGNRLLKEAIRQTATTKKRTPNSSLEFPAKKKTKACPEPSSSNGSTKTEPPAEPRSAPETTSSDESLLVPEEEAHGEEHPNHPASSIRTDLVLPDGVCLRINQRIPAWAIPAQQAAVRHLYQKHAAKVATATAHPPRVLPEPANDDGSDGNPPSSSASSHGSESGRPLKRSSEPRGLRLRDNNHHRTIGRDEDRLGSLLQLQCVTTANRSNESLEETVVDDDDRFGDAVEDDEPPHPHVHRSHAAAKTTATTAAATAVTTAAAAAAVGTPGERECQDEENEDDKNWLVI